MMEVTLGHHGAILNFAAAELRADITQVPESLCVVLGSWQGQYPAYDPSLEALGAPKRRRFDENALAAADLWKNFTLT